MFFELKFLSKKAFAPIAAILSMSACGQGALNTPMQIGHKELLSNFDNFASACFSPQFVENKIKCAKIATFAHYTLTFTEFRQSENLKIQYKARFDEKNVLSCIDYSSMKPDGVKIYQSKDNKTNISDDDIQIQNTPQAATITNEIIIRESKKGQTCAKYFLTQTGNPQMNYKFNFVENVGGKDIPTAAGTNEFAFFSAGSDLIF